MIRHGGSLRGARERGQHDVPEPGHDAHRVGSRLRAHRAATGWSLRDVAERTGVARSTLSRLETGDRRAPLDLLIPLADPYGVTLDVLVGRDRKHRETRHLDRPWTVLPLSATEQRATTSKIVLRGPYDEPTQVSHPGHEWLMVMSGRVRLLLAGREYELVPHQVAAFTTSTPHWFGALPGEMAEIISVFSKTGPTLSYALPTGSLLRE